MTDEDIKEITSAGRMTAFMADNDTLFKNNAKAMALKTALNDDIALMNTAGARGISARGLQKDATQDKRAAEESLEKFLRKIAENGKVIKKDDPAFDNTFKLPRGGFSNQTLLDTARAFIDDLTPTAEAKFTEFGYTSVTPANLQAKIDAVNAGSVQQNEGRSEGIGATASERAVITRLKANRRILKTIGENITEDSGDAALIAEWNSACKIEKAKKPPTPPVPPTP